MKKKIEDVEVNVLYFMARAQYILINDIERRFKARGEGFKQDKKRLFNDCIKRVGQLKHQLERLDEDIVKNCRDVAEFDFMQEDVLKLIRLILLFADRSHTSEDNENEVFKLLRSQEGAGIITEEVLEKFYLKK